MWFSAKVLFESDTLQEESIRLIQAKDEEEALSKALALGKSEQHEYLNDSGSPVKWRFVQVLEVQDLCEENVFDGMEVHSLMKWKVNV